MTGLSCDAPPLVKGELWVLMLSEIYAEFLRPRSLVTFQGRKYGRGVGKKHTFLNSLAESRWNICDLVARGQWDLGVVRRLQTAAVVIRG
jgi:hypothetical protein